jgi:hypothetical protein
VAVIGKKKGGKMSRTPPGLAVIAIGKKNKKHKMSHIPYGWSGHGCHLKKSKKENFHAHHMVWPWPSLAKKRKTKNIMHNV